MLIKLFYNALTTFELLFAYLDDFLKLAMMNFNIEGLYLPDFYMCGFHLRTIAIHMNL